MFQSTAARWAINLVIPLMIYLLGPSWGLAPKMVLFFTITVWGILSWITETLPENLVAILMPAFYVVSHLGTGKQIFAPWGSPIPWLVIGGMMMGMIMMQTGLAKRIALISIKVSGFSFSKVMLGLLLAGFIISPFVPSVMGKAAIISVICLGICDALKLEKGSREGATVLIVGFIAVACPKLAYLTGGGDVVMALNIASKTMGYSVSWSDYFIHNFPLIAVYSVLSLGVVLFVMRPKLSGNLKEYINEQYDALGPVKPEESKSIFILVAMLVLMATSKWHGINSGYVLLFMGAVCFLPGVNLLNQEKLAKMNFGVIFFVVGSMCIGSAAKVAGMNVWVQDLVTPYLDGGLYSTLSAIFGVGAASNFFLTPLAAIATLTAPIVKICQSFNLSPAQGAYTLLFGLDQYIFAYEFAVLLYFYTFGFIKAKHLILVFGARAVMAFAFLLVASIPYWNLLGA